jgi:hypothetical protein
MRSAVAKTGPNRSGFRLLALALPVAILVQVYLAGLAIFSDGSHWALHGAIGGAIAVPIIALVVMAWLSPPLRRHRLLTALLFGLYVLQFVFIIVGEGWGFLHALHPANAVAITVAAVLLAKEAWSE